jgi:SNF2 family DNA or RNA helicase
MTESHLHSYQLHIIDHILTHPSSGIFVEMGLGKTIATLTAISSLMYDSFEIHKVLVIAPKFVAENVWSTETDKWEHTRFLRLSLVTGTEKQRKVALSSAADIYIINRENVVWLVGQYRSHFPFDMIVIDELSSFKSPKAQRFKALRHVLPLIKRIVGLTGTPAPNGLIDLWSQLYLLDQGESLGKRLTLFRDKYFTPGRRNGPVIYEYNLKPGADQLIHLAISGICISMKSADYLELPGRIDHYIKIRLDNATMKKYTDFESTLMLQMIAGEEITAVNAAVLSGKLRQFANGAVYDDDKNFIPIHDAKLEALKELVEQANGNPVLIFYEFRHDLIRIMQILKEFNPQSLSPKSSSSNSPIVKLSNSQIVKLSNSQIVKSSNCQIASLSNCQIAKLSNSQILQEWNKGTIPILLAHPASAGHGLNLQYGGNTVIWFGADWSLELYQQANARLHRQGQSKPVNVYHLITENTIDEDVIKSLASKSSGQESLMKAIKSRLTIYKAN